MASFTKVWWKEHTMYHAMGWTGTDKTQIGTWKCARSRILWCRSIQNELLEINMSCKAKRAIKTDVCMYVEVEAIVDHALCPPMEIQRLDINRTSLKVVLPNTYKLRDIVLITHNCLGPLIYMSIIKINRRSVQYAIDVKLFNSLIVHDMQQCKSIENDK